MPNNHSFAHADATRRHGISFDSSQYPNPPMEAHAVNRLLAWFSGKIVLTRSEARCLLERAVESGRITDHHAEFVAAIKALAAGPNSWHEMGYRLLADD